MRKPELFIWEFGLRRPRAAAFVGCSVGHFDKMVDAGIMPLPTEAGDHLPEEQACGAVFGSRA